MARRPATSLSKSSPPAASTSAAASPPRSLKTLQSGAFTEAFLDKGRLRPILEAMPVRVILDDTCALLGAAGYAETRASELSGHSERAASIQG